MRTFIVRWYAVGAAATSLVYLFGTCPSQHAAANPAPPTTAAITPELQGTAPAPAQTVQEAFWLWTGIEGRPGEKVYFRQRLRFSDKPKSAKLVAESRGPFALYVNGTLIKRYPAGAHTAFITKYLDKGPGVLAFESAGGADASGLRFELSISYPDGRTVLVYSNGDEAASRAASLGWQTIAYDDSRWQRATVIPNPAEPLVPRTPAEPKPGPTKIARLPIPPSRPDPSRLVRLWDIRGSRKTGENLYSSQRNVGERMLLSSGMAPDGDLALLATTGFTLLESSSEALSTPEIAPGAWDLSVPESDRARASNAGFNWSYFSHYAFPPELRGARRNYVPIRCLEHDRSLPAYSPWDPMFLQYADGGFSSLAKAFGNSQGASALDVGVHGDYGEAGYFSGARMTVPHLRSDWFRRFGDDHNHLGWWCGDPIARAAFRGAMIAKYRTVEALNRVWRTEFRSLNDIKYPLSPTDGSRRRWLDFVHWYRESATRMAEGLGESAKKRFSNRLLMLPLGFSDEDPRGGNDNSSLVKMAARVGMNVRSTHGGFRPFAENQATMMGRIGSAARFYDVPLWNEATGKLSPEEETARLFSAISLGAKGIFDWPDNVKTAREVFYKYGKHLRLERPIVDVAMFFPTTSHLLRQEGYPQILARGCTEIRDVLNFDTVDEQMTLDGALARYRILVLWEGIVVESSVLEKIREWVERGGVVVAYDFGKIETPEGERDWFADLFGYAGRMRTLPAPLAGEAEDKIDIERLRSDWAKPFGRGWTVYYPARRNRLRSYYEVVRYLTYHLSELDSTKRDALPIDDAWDGLYGTLLSDKVAYYNPTGMAINRTISLVAASVASQPDLRVRPTFSSYTVNVEPNGIALLSFDAPAQELLFQCEGFRTLNGVKPIENADFHPGRGPSHILLTGGRSISTKIRIDAAGLYRVFYRTIRNGSLARAEVVIDGKTLSGDSKPVSPWSQTLTAGTIRLSAGVYNLTIRPPARQNVRADFVVLCSDPTVEGYAFAEK